MANIVTTTASNPSTIAKSIDIFAPSPILGFDTWQSSAHPKKSRNLSGEAKKMKSTRL
jgi:hypothetical protein